jgi:predicted nucleic acid-binding protein
MGSEETLILIDTNIFVIDLRYKRDANYSINRSFLSAISGSGIGFTTIANLMEVCGILSFNLNQKQLLDLWTYFEERYKISVIPSPDLQSDFPSIENHILFDTISKKMSFGDAFMIGLAQKLLPFVSTMVTWDKEHLKGKYHGEVLTPEEFLLNLE